MDEQPEIRTREEMAREACERGIEVKGRGLTHRVCCQCGAMLLIALKVCPICEHFHGPGAAVASYRRSQLRAKYEEIRRLTGHLATAVKAAGGSADEIQDSSEVFHWTSVVIGELSRPGAENPPPEFVMGPGNEYALCECGHAAGVHKWSGAVGSDCDRCVCKKFERSR